MAKNVCSTSNTKKHLTNTEKKARKQQESKLKREIVEISLPKMVSKTSKAFEYWENILEKAKDVELLDDLDRDVLALYCIQLARRDELEKEYKKTGEDAILGRIQSQEKSILTYAEKLGLTPSSRTRLAKNRAEENVDIEEKEMFG